MTPSHANKGNPSAIPAIAVMNPAHSKILELAETSTQDQNTPPSIIPNASAITHP
jgi:hypothetical protein